MVGGSAVVEGDEMRQRFMEFLQSEDTADGQLAPDFVPSFIRWGARFCACAPPCTLSLNPPTRGSALMQVLL